jgi:hypothetical protein
MTSELFVFFHSAIQNNIIVTVNYYVFFTFQMYTVNLTRF